MPLYSFQLRTGDIAATNPVAAEFRDLSQAIEVGLLTMAERAVRDPDATTRLGESVLEIVDEDGDVVASLPIADVISRH